MKAFKSFLVAVVVGAAAFAAMLAIDRFLPKPKAKPPEYSECVTCHHLFKPGTGKDVVRDYAQFGVSTNTYCLDHAPKYDREEIGRFLVSQSPWKQVNMDGSEINPHKCPEPPSCGRAHIESRTLTDDEWRILERYGFTNASRLNVQSREMTNGIAARLWFTNVAIAFTNDGYFGSSSR